MPDPKNDIIKQVKQWLAYAEEDMDLARFTRTHMEGAPLRLIAYHAQQCAEKCLKAYLVYQGIDFPYTHNIARLLELCSNTNWLESLQEAEELSPYAISTRYPGFDESVDEAEVVRAIEIAEVVRRAVYDKLIQLGVLD